MTEKSKTELTSEEKDSGFEGGIKSDDAVPTRRKMLMMGAVGMTAVATVRPAMAQSAGSVLNCTITVPAQDEVGYETVIDPITNGPIQQETTTTLPGATYSGEQIRRGYVPSHHMRYIRSLKRGQSGFTCFASIAGRRY